MQRVRGQRLGKVIEEGPNEAVGPSRYPVAPERRRSTPLFCAGDCDTPMSHEVANVLFHAACALCFEPSVANALSLHSGRVWLACALLAADYHNPTIQAMCRWLSPAAVRIYAHT